MTISLTPLILRRIQMLLAVVFTATALEAQAQVTFTNLHSFGVFTNGVSPRAGLAQGSDGNFYGTTQSGGTNGGYGTVFKMSTNGLLMSLYSFAGGDDGEYPVASLVQDSDGNFYGTTSGGTSSSGNTAFGTVFKITAGGTLTPLYSFTNGADGASPLAGLAQGSGGNFYGTTSSGGTNGAGTIFKISAGGSFTPLYSFTNGIDGASPAAALVEGSDGNFYGTTSEGGSNNDGAVFKITASGSFAPLYSFTGGKDGRNPAAALVQGSNGSFYGTAPYGGGGPGNGFGAVFAISAGGSLTPLYSFTGGKDGGNPAAALALGSDGNFYGTTQHDGTNGFGTMFKISAGGTLTPLYSFTNGNDGNQPEAGLVQGGDGHFYGTTTLGGADNNGAAFRMSASGSLTPLYSFTGGNDGLNPMAGLVQGSECDFYGTAQEGGPYHSGAVFKICSCGSLSPLYYFTNGYDGSQPEAPLVQGRDGYFYGTSPYGGRGPNFNGFGTVFKISGNGSLVALYSFTGGNDGANPEAALVQGSDGYFYGTTTFGGTNGFGAVFKISPGGSLTPLYSFTGGDDGKEPEVALALGRDGNFYGTTTFGGSNQFGNVFKITPSGSLISLYSFTGGNDGGNPDGALVQGGDGNFYGTTVFGGTNGSGAVFRISSSGSFTPLYSFNGGLDGANPEAALAQGRDGNFYGTTSFGGANGFGTVFKITAAGSLTTLYSFTGGNDGGQPEAGLVQGNDGNFYGTTSIGGIGGNGVVFCISAGIEFVAITTCNTAFGFANGMFGFDLVGPVGSNVVIQASADLKTWIPLQTNLVGSGALYFSDPQSPTNRQRFYRAVLP